MSERGEQLEWVMFLGMILFVIGFTLIFLGSLISAAADVSTGGVIIIGPIPILLGSGPYGQILTLISALIALFVVILYFVHIFRGKKIAQ